MSSVISQDRGRALEADRMAVATPSVEPTKFVEPQLDGKIPPLENGDRMTRAEFERRYHAMPNLKKAELIEGVVFMPSPVRHEQHSRPHSILDTWLGFYAVNTPGIDSGDNGSIRLDLDNEPQPDAYLVIRPERGGQVRISDDDYVEGAPELTVEVSPSSVSYDLGDKLDAYLRNGVREYVVWRVQDGKIDWFVNQGGRFEPLAPSAEGILRSTVFPGLWMDPAALIRGDLPAAFAVLQRGLNSPEHADYVAKFEQVRAI